MNTDTVEVLAIVQVDPDKRVLCQAPSCNRHIYKAVHVIRENGKIAVIGSVCMKRIFGAAKVGKSLYTGGSSRRLTPEERQLLEENTQALIRQLEGEHWEAQKALALEAKERIESESPPEPATVATPSAPKGQGRQVKCHYCRRDMITYLSVVPAMGYKCDHCVAAKAALPRRSRGISR